MLDREKRAWVCLVTFPTKSQKRQKIEQHFINVE